MSSRNATVGKPKVTTPSLPDRIRLAITRSNLVADAAEEAAKKARLNSAALEVVLSDVEHLIFDNKALREAEAGVTTGTTVFIPALHGTKESTYTAKNRKGRRA